MDRGDERDGEEPEEERRGRVPHHGADEPVRAAGRGGGAHARTAAAASSNPGVRGCLDPHARRLTHPPSQAHHGKPGTAARYVAAGATATDRSCYPGRFLHGTAGEEGEENNAPPAVSSTGEQQWRREEEDEER